MSSRGFRNASSLLPRRCSPLRDSASTWDGQHCASGMSGQRLPKPILMQLPIACQESHALLSMTLNTLHECSSAGAGKYAQVAAERHLLGDVLDGAIAEFGLQRQPWHLQRRRDNIGFEALHGRRVNLLYLTCHS